MKEALVMMFVILGLFLVTVYGLYTLEEHMRTDP